MVNLSRTENKAEVRIENKYITISFLLYKTQTVKPDPQKRERKPTHKRISFCGVGG